MENNNLRKLVLPMLVASLAITGCSSAQNQQENTTDTVKLQDLVKKRNSEIATLKSSMTSLEGNLSSEQTLRKNLESQLQNNSAAGAGNALLPPNAQPGECYARAYIPPTYRTESETVLKREASERLEAIPAKYGTAQQTVTVREASERVEVIPATYGYVEEQVLVKAASTRLKTIPPVYKTETQKVLVKPEQTTWKKGTGPITKIDEATGEIMCLVTIPAVYQTVTKRVLVTPATTREIEVPAVYKTVKRRVVKTPASTRTIVIPAVTKNVNVRTLVEPAKTRSVVIPAQHQTITRRIQVTDSRLEWRPILCKTNMNRDIAVQIQQGLKKAGHNPGPIDGIIGRDTLSAMKAYQRANNLPTGGLTIRSLKNLGVKL